jgi:hypothetical protein
VSPLVIEDGGLRNEDWDCWMGEMLIDWGIAAILQSQSLIPSINPQSAIHQFKSSILIPQSSITD